MNTTSYFYFKFFYIRASNKILWCAPPVSCGGDAISPRGGGRTGRRGGAAANEQLHLPLFERCAAADPDGLVVMGRMIIPPPIHVVGRSNPMGRCSISGGTRH